MTPTLHNQAGHRGFNKTSVDRRYIGQGEFAVSQDEGTIISTLLGSCVAVCLWDRHINIGGMNHVVISDATTDSAVMFGHAVNGMELLINNLLANGGNKENLTAKVFGGAQFSKSNAAPGRKNIQFVLQYLENEAIPCVGGSIGGAHARRVEFIPTHGHARQKIIVDKHIETTTPIMHEADIQIFDPSITRRERLSFIEQNPRKPRY